MNQNSPNFLLAAEQIKKLKLKPTDQELLELYGLYKQATVGDINIDKPFFTFGKDYEKWKVWNSFKGTSVYDSECKYITLVNTLINKYQLK